MGAARKTSPRLLVALSVGAVAGGLLAGWARAPGRQAPRADQVVLQALDGGGTVRLASFRGRPLVVNYFASWCAPCAREMPAFARVHRDLEGQVAFLGVAFRDDPAAARRLAEVSGVSYPLAADPDGASLIALGGRGMPTTLFVGTDGRVLEAHTGPLSGPALRRRIVRNFGAGRR